MTETYNGFAGCNCLLHRGVHRHGPLALRCPYCRCNTLGERGGYDVCPVCFWEDDGQYDHDASVTRGGPNGSLSLSQARLNYANSGACEERFIGNVRPPHPHELPAGGRTQPAQVRRSLPPPETVVDTEFEVAEVSCHFSAARQADVVSSPSRPEVSCEIPPDGLFTHP